MHDRRLYKAITRTGADFFNGLAVAYFIGVPLSPNAWTLTDNVVFCILCVFYAFVLTRLSDNE